jgi:uncharacterized protein YegL
MSIFEQVGEISKREMVIFFLIDQSGSMNGTKMGAVNTAIREVIPELRGIGGADVRLKIAVLLFSGGCHWMFDAPVDVDTFQWNTIEAGGVTDMGAAFTALREKMSKNEFLTTASGSVAPALFLMSDGLPGDDWRGPLEELKRNRWFSHSIRIAVAIGEDADPEMLAQFTGNPEAVVTAHTPEALRKLIRFISITSSQVGSTSGLIGGEVQKKQDMIASGLQNFVNNDAALKQSASDDWD